MRLAWPLLSCLALVLAVARPPAVGDVMVVTCAPVLLDPTDPARRSVGRLLFESGFVVAADDLRLGGLSAVRVSGDGSALVAISDCGDLLRAPILRDGSGRITGLGPTALRSLSGLGGRPLGLDEGDAEGLARDARGGMLISFERRHRVWRYADEACLGAPVPLEVPTAVSNLPFNSGLETLVALAEHQSLLLAEGGPDCAGLAPAWIGREGSWKELRFPLYCAPSAPTSVFNPTDGAELPDGSLLVLERRFPPVGARLRLIARQELERGDLRGQEIALLELPMTVDNFEGLDAWRDGTGRTRVLLLSDDNNCRRKTPVASAQRTLLLEFSLSD